ncbi:uncharacterized protein [Lepidochelys kempii]|uniref:uncharacterized protein isoform X2 n=1 Tax=Lepidochelys kempii TaxID=8472 RepID=UPI003C6F4312
MSTTWSTQPSGSPSNGASQEGALLRYVDTNVHDEPSGPKEDVSGEEMPDLPVSQSAGDLAATAASVSPSQMDVTMHFPEEKCRSEKSVVEAQETAAAEFSSLSLEDPGLWTPLSGSLKDFLVLHGPQQVKNFMSPKTMVVSDAASATSSEAAEFFTVIQSIDGSFSASTHRWQILKQHLGTSSLTLKPLSAKQWESRVEAIKPLKHQIGKIDDAIVAIMEDNAVTGTVHGRTVAEGNGITRNIPNFKFLCGLVLWHDILFEINVVSKRLQGVDLDISGAMEQLDKAKSYLRSYRSDEGFQNVLKSAQKLAEELHTEAIFPPIQEHKSHRRRRHFDYEAQDNPIRDPKQQFKVEFLNQVLDCAIQAVEERFMQLREHSSRFGML